MTSPDLATLPHGQPTWLNSAAHRYWLENEGQRLLAFYRASRIETGGFGPLDDHGRLPNNARADTMITARMTHCFALACQRGEPGAAPLAEHGLACLQGDLRDSRFGGWYAQVPHEGFDDAKQCYILVLVALARLHRFSGRFDRRTSVAE